MSLSASLLRAATAPAVLPLWPEGVPGQLPHEADEKSEEGGRISNVHVPTLTFFPAPAATANGTAIVVCPGGGYARLAFPHEGVQVAEWLNTLGISAFVLKYRHAPYHHPAPLQDALRAIRLVRSRAAEFGVRADRIGVMGFSAGGHLTASTGVLFDDPDGRTGAPLDAVSARPDFIAPIYAVVTMTDPFVHAGSRLNLIGKNPTPAQIAHLSPEQNVTKNSPPAFLVHTGADKTVPVENSILFYRALQKAGVSAELHLFADGPHGVGIKPGFGQMSEWPKRFEEWARSHGWLTK
jgi:acetyl esterase/lipase